MKSATLWRRTSPTFDTAEEYLDGAQRREFRPEPLVPLANDREEAGLTQPQNRSQKVKPVRPKLRVLPDPHPRAGEHSGNAAGGAIRLYLREIGHVKLLAPEEEIQLVARTRKGDRKARERLIKGNLRRVVEISREYENIGLPLLDLISEGNLGLLKAVERFSPTNGTSFAEFSTWWIKQSIKRSLARSS